MRQKESKSNTSLSGTHVGHVIGVNYACVSVRFRCVLITKLHDSHSYSLLLH